MSLVLAYCTIKAWLHTTLKSSRKGNSEPVGELVFKQLLLQHVGKNSLNPNPTALQSSQSSLSTNMIYILTHQIDIVCLSPKKWGNPFSFWWKCIFFLTCWIIAQFLPLLLCKHCTIWIHNMYFWVNKFVVCAHCMGWFSLALELLYSNDLLFQSSTHPQQREVRKIYQIISDISLGAIWLRLSVLFVTL